MMSVADPLATVVSRLEPYGGHWEGDEYRSRCPVCGECDNRTLKTSLGDTGCVIFKCYKRDCKAEAITKVILITMRDLWPSNSTPNGVTRPKPRSAPAKKPKRAYPSHEAVISAVEKATNGTFVAEWVYPNPAPAPREWDEMRVVRVAVPSGGKNYRPIHRVGAQWYLCDPPGMLPLYRLSELSGHHRVYIVEGEKAADALSSIGITATTSAHGNQAAGSTNWTPLAGREVVIWPDNDEPGQKYATAVTSILARLNPPVEIRVLNLPELPKGGDAADYIEARDSVLDDDMRAGIEELADEAPIVDSTHESNSAVDNTPSNEAADGFVSVSAHSEWKPYPVEALPRVMKRFVLECAKAIGVDPSFIANPLLSGFASAIGNSRRVLLKRGWWEPCVVWTGNVGESGTQKSPSVDAAIRSIRRRQERAFIEHEENLSLYEDEHRQWQQANKSTRGAEPVEPKEKRYLVSDITVEAMAEKLADSPRGLLLVRDELSGWFGSFDAYKRNKGADSAHWLEMFGARSMTVDRKSNRKPVYIPMASLSITGGVQPSVLSRSLGHEHIEDGLAARFLFSMPPRRAKAWTENEISPEIEAKIDDIYNALFSLSMVPGEDRDSPVYIPLSDDGKAAFIKFCNEHGREQAELTGELASAWSKLEGYAARIAMIIHYVRWSQGESIGEEIDAQSIQAGVTLVRWYGNEARRIYDVLNESSDETESRDIIELMNRRGGEITPRELTRSSRKYKTSDQARYALEQVVSRGLASKHYQPASAKGGRPSEVFKLY